MKNQLMQIFKDEEGQAMTEYGLIIALVAVVVMAGLGVLAGNINGLFNGISFAPKP